MLFRRALPCFKSQWAGRKLFITGYQFSTSQKPHGIFSRLQWFGIPVSLGMACVGFLHFRKVLREERVNPASPHPMTWQLVMFLQIPTRAFSRLWGSLMDKEISPSLRVPLLGLYKVVFGCNMDEAEETNLKKYKSFKSLFVRKLKEGVRPIDPNHHLVSPIDGKILHFGLISKDSIEQVKGVYYSLNAFLGPGLVENWTDCDTEQADGTRLHHVVLYLSPGDCHHFYSPADWQATLSRHLPGELLTVAPWAARSMPGLFALNERLILNGNWKYGTFSFAAVGAYNVGSISVDMDENIKTNQKGKYVYGTFMDKDLRRKEGGGIELVKGNHIGVFNMGSSIVLIFEAPKDFKFVVNENQVVKIGEPLGKCP